MGKKKKHAKKKKGKRASQARKWEKVHAELMQEQDTPRFRARVNAYGRLVDVEQRLYDFWEQRSDGEMSWVGELMGDIVDENKTLWLAAIGDKVAALGGHLELTAVFPNETLTLLIEPGLHAAVNNDDDHEDEPGDDVA